MKILVIEDDLLTADTIEKLLINNGHEVRKARNSQEAIKHSDVFWPQLAIVDINLKHSSSDGIEIATYLKENYSLPILFLTAKNDVGTFALAKAVHPVAYLLKPFNPQELIFQVELAYEHFLINQTKGDPQVAESVFFPDKNGFQKINKKDVSYLKASGGFTFIFTSDGNQIMVTGNIGYYSQFFPSGSFFQCHRSFIVNLRQIRAISEDKIYLNDLKDPVPIAISRRSEFLKRISLIRSPA